MTDGRSWAPAEWGGGDYVLAPPPTPPHIYLCTACFRLGACRLGLETERLQDGIVTTTLVCSADNEGGPGVAHGAWIAGVFDELSGHVPLLQHKLAVTKTMTIQFFKPVPIERALVGTARAVHTDERRWLVEAALVLASNSTELARAEAVMTLRDPGHYERHRRWLAAQEREQAEQATGASSD
jgi:acyl-coenzyme A thioesterase PaaI-like protein